MFIKFTETDFKKCQTFANTIDTSFYATRHQFNKDKRIKDNIIGKLGEIATLKYFKSKDIELSSPDFNIYNRNQKSWDYDLKGKNINLHCKSQSVEQGKKYGISFIFENTDKHIFKEVNGNDYVSFISVDLENLQAEIKAIIKLQDLHNKKLFAKPKLSYLTTKSAIYLDDLKNVFKNSLFAK